MKYAKDDKKILRFDMSKDRLLDVASENMENGRVLRRLSMLNKCVNRYGIDGEIYEMYADAYEEMGLTSYALNIWYAYLDDCYDYADREEIYEGIAVNYMNLGMEIEALVYYKKLIDECVRDGIEADIDSFPISEVFGNKESEFKVLPKKEEEESARAISEGLNLFRSGDLSGAAQRLSAVTEGAENYVSARNIIAVCHMLGGDSEKGIQVCEEFLKDHPDDVQTMTTLAAIYNDTGEREKSRALALKLCAMNVSSNDELLKIATVACENGLDDKALEKLKILENNTTPDKHLLYFLAVCEYKSGNYTESRKYFLKILCIDRNASVAKYYLSLLTSYIEELKTNASAKKPDIPYIYKINSEKAEQYIEILCAAGKKSVAAFEQLYSDGELYDAAVWAFDEMDAQEIKLQALALRGIIKTGKHEDFLRGIFVRYDISDAVKAAAMHELVMRNKPCAFNIVVKNMFRRFCVRRIRLGTKKRNLFLSVAAELSACYAFVNENNVEKIAAVVENVYDNTVRLNPDFYCSKQALLATVFIEALIDEKQSVSYVANMYNADKKEVRDLLAMTLVNPYALDESAASETSDKDE